MSGMAVFPGGGGAVPLLTPPEHHWECDCGRTAVTREARPHSPMHACTAVRGLLAPYRPAGTRGHVTSQLREDFEAHGARVGGAETLQRDDAGRPHTSVTAEYDTPDGPRQHHAIFVPGINIDLRIGS